MFVDVAKIKIKGGDGGAGAVAFHREKYVAAGGPYYLQWDRRWGRS